MSWVARLSRNMQEVRLVLCNKNAQSQGAREFIDRHYVQIKQLNPRLPFLVRHGNDVAPHFIARYDYGGEAQRDLSNMTVEQIKAQLQELNSIGEVALKADLYPWQESVPKDMDTITYNPADPTQRFL